MKKIHPSFTIFFVGILFSMSLYSISAAQPAHAALGSDIVCIVFNTLNGVGAPIPPLDTTNCPNSPVPSTGILRVSKIVIGGVASPSDFSIHVKSDESDISGSPQPGSIRGTTYVGIPPGNYAVSESGGPENYSTSFSSGCNSDGTVAVASSSIPVVCLVTNTFHTPPSAVENTLALCSDTIDNDSNSLIDLADPSCIHFTPKLTVTKVVINDNGGTGAVSDFPLFVDGILTTSGVVSTSTVGVHTITEAASTTYAGTFSGDCNTSGHITLAIGDTKTCTLTNNDIAQGSQPATTQCADGIDNDGDGLVDAADPGCHTDFNAGNSASYDRTRDNESATAPSGNITPPSGGNTTNDTSNGGGGGGGVIFGPLSVGFQNGGGLVLGTSTVSAALTASASCGLSITSYMRMGRKNDPDQVKKLQTFLNEHMQAGLPVSGNFGPLTDAAVRKFQKQYSQEVLLPWVPYGLKTSLTTTGYVYKTTQRKINLILCSELTIPMPMLP